MNYQFKDVEGVCDECEQELWFGQSEAPHADLCDGCYEMEILDEECEAPVGHFMHKADE